MFKHRQISCFCCQNTNQRGKTPYFRRYLLIFARTESGISAAAHFLFFTASEQRTGFPSSVLPHTVSVFSFVSIHTFCLYPRTPFPAVSSHCGQELVPAILEKLGTPATYHTARCAVRHAAFPSHTSTFITYTFSDMLYAQGIVRFGISLPNTQAFCFQIWRSLCFCTQRPFERHPTVLLIFAILFYCSFISMRISRINILLSHFPISPMISCSPIFYASVLCSAFPKMIFTKDI